MHTYKIQNTHIGIMEKKRDELTGQAPLLDIIKQSFQAIDPGKQK